MSQSAYQLFLQQKKFLEELQKTRPDLFIADKIFSESEVLPQIGITALPQERLSGYIRLYPQDFIVEEISQEKKISSIEPQENQLVRAEEKNLTLYADLIKVGISTLEALSRLAKKLALPVNKIGYAGIKDAQALTSQRIALPKINYEQIKDLKFESFFLTNFAYGQGSLQAGNLLGNRFTIFIRTEEEISTDWLKKKVANLKTNGFLNFFYTQRFGGARLLSHLLGRLVLQQRYEDAVKLFLTQPNVYSIKLINKVRQQATEHFGHWPEMKKILNHLPYTFQLEIKILDYLIHQPQNFLGALIHLQDQTTLWVYAYVSWLFNQYLSQRVLENKSLPEKLPLPLSQDPEDQKLYQPWLAQDKINITQALAPLKFIPVKKRFVVTKILPSDILAMSTSEGVILSFFLPRGAYATTFLANLFKLQQGLPLPQWLKTTKCDTKKFLQLGTCEPAEKILKDYIFSVLDFKQKK